MKSKIVGRKEEQAVLDELYNSDESHLLAVYGRRRVGKTFLIREYFEKELTFYHTALSPKELEDQPDLLYRAQLSEFGKTLNRYGYKSDIAPKDWFDAFDRLVELLKAKSRRKRMVVFLDELPWLDTPRAGFMTAFEHFWNGWGAGQHNLLLIVCGSAMTWMLDKLINNKGGLYDRTGREIHVHPFTLAECEAYYKKKGISLDRYDIVQSYMILGGIPYYMSYFQKGKSLAQNIDSLFFGQSGRLRDEFDRLFTSLFGDNEAHRKIVSALASHRYGILRNDIIAACEMTSGGNVSDILKALEKSDLIKPYNNFGETKRNTYYRLSDPFCLFYLNFARKNPTGNPTFWQDNLNSPKLNAWRGLAFEDVCFVHQKEIRAALGIAGVQAEIYPWHSDASGSTSGAQIDMLVDRVDRVINLCEMKFCQAEYTITKDYDAKMRAKLDKLMMETGRKRNIQTVFVTTYGLKSNMYSGKVQRVITMDDLFGKV